MLREPARLYYSAVIIFNCLAYWSSTDSNVYTQFQHTRYIDKIVVVIMKTL